MRIAMAVPGLDADGLEVALLRAGHRVVWRALTADEVLEQLAATAPDAVLVGDHPDVATPAVIGACDLLGVRSLLVADGSTLSAAARRLGVLEYLMIERGSPIDLTPLEAGPLHGARRDGASEDVPAQPSTKEHAPSPEPSAVPPTHRAMGGRSAGETLPPERHARDLDPVTPRVIAVWGPAGAPGRTTLAIGLAAELAQRGLEVCLVDADTYGGAIAPALGLLDESPGFAAACRLAGADSLTESELDRVAQRAPVGSMVQGFGSEVRVLTGIGRPHRWPELSADRVTRVLEFCRAWRPIIIVDVGFSLESDEEISSDLLGPRRNAATIAALRAADEIIAVGTADPLGLARLLRTYPDLLELVEAPRTHVVINRLRSSVLGLDPAGQVRQTLERFGGVRDAVLIDDDPAAADAALLAGRSVVDAAPRSALRAGIARLADALALGVRVPAMSKTAKLAARLRRRTG